MRIVEDQLRRFEADSVFSAVGSIFVLVPLKVHLVYTL